jgi:hypothetical protein
VHPYVTMTITAALSSDIRASIFGVTYAGGILLDTAVTAESCAAVTPAKTMSVTIVKLMRCFPDEDGDGDGYARPWHGIDFTDDLIDEF